MEGPAHVLRASAVCCRWHELACAGSVWHAKLEREGILDKAKAFKIEVPPLVREGGLLGDEEMASMAFYARVFALKGYQMSNGGTRRQRGYTGPSVCVLR